MQKRNRNEQAQAFISALHNTGWRSLREWRDDGYVFELLALNGHTVIVEIYPEGQGFEVWRPASESNAIADTAVAVAEWGAL